MIFSNKYNFGVTEKTFLNEFSIGYLNLCKVKTSIGYTACDATSLDKNSKVAIKKCYSEYLERFSMGIPIDRDIKTEVVELVNKNVKNNLFSSLPITKNISKSLRKEIVKRYYIDKEVDCPIV